MLDQLVAAKGAQVRLRVADVDREQHPVIMPADRIPTVEAKLYVIPGSHPSRTAMRMLEIKGISYKRVDLMPVVSRGVLRAMGFPGVTIPALRIGDRKITGSREIAKELDRVQPDPPLFPAEPDARASVEQAEAWGDEALQGVARRILWNALKRDRTPLASYSEGARLGVPIGLAVKTAAPIVALEVRINEANDERVREDLAALPGMLQRIDDWIAAGVLGGDDLNAADLQIGTSVRLLMSLQDLREGIAARPAGELAMRAAPDYPGDAPPVLPAAWLEPMRREPAAAA
jgi:glutathione S-transferase